MSHPNNIQRHLSQEHVRRKLCSLTREYTDSQFRLLLRKSVYPYQYMDTSDRFLETELPPPSMFYSSLSGSGISDSNYKHTQEIWRELSCSTIGDYHDLYLYTDTLFLSFVFENFRELCISNYGLDPVHYYTAPGLMGHTAQIHPY